ncbi:MAG TPA: Lrp/AsnC family transcriptional regulator [Anaerolineae bacterium]|nr:Lrp/AsnC family transcriptional regulator [Anaerolineae bacterium]
MIEYLQTAILDDLDKAILQALQADGRISNADLARQINLSPPAVHARIKRLEKHGYIRQYTALLDPEKAGYDMICFVHLSLQVHQHQQVETIRLTIQQMPEVLECYHLTGEFDYLMKVVIHNRQDLERFVMQRLTILPGVARVQTGIVLSAVKSTTNIPLQ